MLMIPGGSLCGSRLPPARGGATPGRGELCSSKQIDRQLSPRVTTTDFFNQVAPFYLATSGPLLHVHSHLPEEKTEMPFRVDDLKAVLLLYFFSPAKITGLSPTLVIC